MACAVAFLASDDSAYITGQVIYVDGGYSAGKLTAISVRPGDWAC